MRYVRATTGVPWTCEEHGGSYVLEKQEGQPFKWLYADGATASAMFVETHVAKIANGEYVGYTKPFPAEEVAQDPVVQVKIKPALPPLELNIKAKGKAPVVEYVPIGSTYRSVHNNMVGLLCKLNPTEAQLFVVTDGVYKGNVLSATKFIIYEHKKVKITDIQMALGFSWVKE